MRGLNEESAWLVVASAVALSMTVFGKHAIAADSTVPGGFPTIQAAIDDLGTMAGDTIFVSGLHTEPLAVTIDKAVTIAGDGIGSTVIDNTSGIGFRPLVAGITIRDLTFTGGSQAIRFELANGTIDGTTILRVEMLDQSSRGIEVHNATTVSNLLIDRSRFIDTNGVNSGLRVSSSGHLDDVTFRDVLFDGMDIGIYVANDGGTSTAKKIDVTGNTFQNIRGLGKQFPQGTAIFVEELQDAVIEGNIFTNNRRDIQIFKWYQASVPVTNVIIRNNTMTDTKDAVFAIFNREHSSGQTVFAGVTFTSNTAVIDALVDDDRGAVFAGAHSGPGQGGLGWNTVQIACNTFLQAKAGSGVRFFNPGNAFADDQLLGGASIDVTNNWWGSADQPTVAALMQVAAITTFEPFLGAAPTADCPNPTAAPLDHFVCYRVKENTKLPDEVVSLEDQFGLQEDVTVKKARILCVPASKNGEGVNNSEAHLTCYDLKSKQDPKQEVLVTHQFGEQELEVKKADLLCLPSTKEAL